ncbi:DUF7146 domain-containing protein, partial [Pseudomonas syringae]
MTSKYEKTEYTEPLSKTIENLVRSAGGWLSVISRMTNTFDSALTKLGKSVDCPFPHRHGSGGGKGDFRFSNDAKYEEGRAICTCMQSHGMGAMQLLLEDGIGGGNMTKCMLAVFNMLNPDSRRPYVRKETTPVVQPGARISMDQKEVVQRKKRLDLIARDLVNLFHPSAAPARKYFAKRGIPLNENIQDVRFHPGLKYWVDGEDGSDKKVLVGVFPTIVSAFRSKEGRVVNFHRIFITEDGDKAPVSEVKKICSPLPKFRGSSIAIATTEGRVLHVTEGVEQGWAIHLATGESVKAAYSCSSLPTLHVDKAQFDKVVIWSDCD